MLKTHRRLRIALLFVLCGTASALADPLAARLIYPPSGGLCDSHTPFQWSSAPGAISYSLRVGRLPGAGDLVSAPDIQALFYPVAPLPHHRRLYATLGTRGANGSWTYSSSEFLTTYELFEPAHMVFPRPDAIGIDAGHPFEWSENPLVSAFRLEIGTSPGAHDLDDSHEIHVTRRFVRNLAPAKFRFGRLSARVGNRWYWTDFTFTVESNSVTDAAQTESALWATDYVRRMADDRNQPYPWTYLETFRHDRGHPAAFCSDYSSALYFVLKEMNILIPATTLNTCFNTNHYDCHTLILLNVDAARPMILDPTFDLTARSSRSGQWATPEEISEATRNRDWSAIDYVTLGDRGDLHARQYYLDYPLLFLNIDRPDQPMEMGEGSSPLPFLAQKSLPLVQEPGIYFVRATGESASVIIDGREGTLLLDGIDSLSHAFSASSVASSTPQGLQLLSPNRFVF